MGCVLVALVAPSEQLRQPQLLVQELSRCGALQGCPKVFLLLSSDPGGECLGLDPSSKWGGGWVGELGADLLPTHSSCLLHHQLVQSLEPFLLAWGSSAAALLTCPCCSCSQRWGAQEKVEGARPTIPSALL